METIRRNVADLDGSDRSALERIVGHALDENQRLVIQVTSNDSTPPNPPAAADADLPEWCDVYGGLSDAEIDDLDAAILERANLSRPAGPT
ncbi:MAG TPA: hypothetical protein VL371_03360 [Gemmataceae bacterium]|nr:hypothetical protein [Gemmataceae bacterium]